MWFFFFISLKLVSFIIWSSACAFRLFGINALLVQNALLLLYACGFFQHYFKYWSKVWESHKDHNENVALDLANGRYGFLNNFDMTENKKVKYSNPALMKMALAVSPIGGAITLLFTQHGDRTTPILICWLLSVPVILGGYKLVIVPVHHFFKISYYEKLIGKPIVNGFLDERNNMVRNRSLDSKTEKEI